MSVHSRGAGVAIVREGGRFVGRVIRIGTGWQAWSCQPRGELLFIGWGKRRRDAVALLTPRSG